MKKCPVVLNVPAEIESTPDAWTISSIGDVSGRIVDFPDAFPCRIEASKDNDVVQLGIGTVSSRLCNAVYSRTLDSALAFEAKDLKIYCDHEVLKLSWNGPLVIMAEENLMSAHRGLPFFKPLDRKEFPRPPSGWCSWYEYNWHISEEEIVRMTDWIEKNLKPYGCEWIQIDDGWQGVGKYYGSNRQWFVTCKEKFPQGMKFLADYIRSKGMRPGIWCIPHVESDVKFFTKNLELFIRNDDGTSIGEFKSPEDNWAECCKAYDCDKLVDWCGRYFLDVSNPRALERVRLIVKMLADEWGYDYVKIDAQGGLVRILTRERKKLFDRKKSPEEMYRNMLLTIKEVLGEKRFLLNCAKGFDSAGICEGVRTGDDINLNAGWEGMLPAIRSTMRYLHYNTIAFYTDPDAVCVRDPLPFETARLWTVLVGITGQMLMSSDILYKLSEQRVDFLRKIYPVADIHPMELYSLRENKMPRIFDLKVNVPGVGEWDVAALFNWDSKEPAKIAISPEILGLEPGSYVYVNASYGKILYVGDRKVYVDIPPMECRVIGMFRKQDHPHVIGTNRHLTIGAVDLESVAWDNASSSLCGRSKVVGGYKYKVWIYVPEGWAVESPDVEIKGDLAVLSIKSSENQSIDWKIDFRKSTLI
ncbi:MAG: glycoside hydrolase family 36 protein [Victivallales bacterium]